MTREQNINWGPLPPERSIRCPCVHFDPIDGEGEQCECGHVRDEHECESGPCQAEVKP